jgi:hypothetical protein
MYKGLNIKTIKYDYSLNKKNKQKPENKEKDNISINNNNLINNNNNNNNTNISPLAIISKKNVNNNNQQIYNFINRHPKYTVNMRGKFNKEYKIILIKKINKFEK